MRPTNPYALLFILVVTVPVVVGGAGLASFLLLRAGYGLLVGGGLPLLAMLLIVGCLGAILGRALDGNLPGRSGSPGEKSRGGSSRKGTRRGDDV